jgi:hypothetical protein
LGHALLTALAEQGWTLIRGRVSVVVISPRTGQDFVILQRELEDEVEFELRLMVLRLVVHGLVWPWPPEHDGIHGEIPRFIR